MITNAQHISVPAKSEQDVRRWYQDSFGINLGSKPWHRLENYVHFDGGSQELVSVFFYTDTLSDVERKAEDSLRFTQLLFSDSFESDAKALKEKGARDIGGPFKTKDGRKYMRFADVAWTKTHLLEL